MGYYMRFFDVVDQPPGLPELNAALQAVDPKYQLAVEASGKSINGVLFYDQDVYAEVELNRPGDGLFEEEIEEMVGFLADAQDGDREWVEDMLRRSRQVVAVRVLWQDRKPDATLEKIDPLWDWLFDHREGLLHADGEGYYDADGLILSEELRDG